MWLKMMGGSNPLQELDHLQSMLGPELWPDIIPVKIVLIQLYSGLSVWGPIGLQLAF